VEVSPRPVPGRDPQVVDAYAPSEVAHRVHTAGVEDARRGLLQTFALSVIGGAMLGLAAAATTAAMAGSTSGYGQTRIVGGLVFGLGLTLVMVGGGELFTSNNLIAMAWVSREVRTIDLAVNWVLVLVGNAAGAASVAVLLVVGGAYGNGDGVAGQQALLVAAAKSGRSFEQDVALGILGNALVCLAVWLCFSARSTTDRILSCVLPMIALVVLNVDHVVANLHYLTAGLLLRADAVAAAGPGVPSGMLADLTWGNAVVNVVGVTIGNVIGGSVLVATVYWFVYLREGRRSPTTPRSGR
jgi:formate transporter